MNIGRFIELARLLTELEGRSKLQKRLGNLAARIQDIVNSPQDAQHQTNTANALDELEVALEGISGELNPSLLDFLSATNGNPFFLRELSDGIAARVRASGITPAVAKKYLDDLIAKRTQYLENLKNANQYLKALKFSEYKLDDGLAELGFKIPRPIFENKLPGLARELEFIDFLVSTFCEAVTGRRDEGQLAQLSTSDPVVLITTLAPVAACIAASIKWSLDAYHRYLEILEMRAKLADIDMPKDTIVELEKKANDKLIAAIEESVARILTDKPQGRKAELANGLRYALRGLLARIERGYTVEVRFLPQVEPETATEEQVAETARRNDEHQKLQRDLVFPPTSSKPLLAIPQRPNGKSVQAEPKPRQRKQRKPAIESEIKANLKSNEHPGSAARKSDPPT